MTERDADPFGSHRFRVTCDALPPLGFTAVRGLSVAVEVRADADAPASRHGRRRWDEMPDHPRVAPSPAHRETRSPTLELRRGLTDDDALWSWLQRWVAGDVDPQDVSVCLLDGCGAPVRGWVCRAAVPVRWVGPELLADRARVATEAVELTHEGIDAVTDLRECACDGDDSIEHPARRSDA